MGLSEVAMMGRSGLALSVDSCDIFSPPGGVPQLVVGKVCSLKNRW
jgi:hypothetical protein